MPYLPFSRSLQKVKEMHLNNPTKIENAFQKHCLFIGRKKRKKSTEIVKISTPVFDEYAQNSHPKNWTLRSKVTCPWVTTRM
jgi:hypothetical protein